MIQAHIDRSSIFRRVSYENVLIERPCRQAQVRNAASVARWLESSVLEGVLVVLEHDSRHSICSYPSSDYLNVPLGTTSELDLARGEV